MVGLVVLTAATIGLLTNRSIEAVALPRALAGIDAQTRFLALELEASVRGARADVIGFRSAVAVDGIVKASLAGGVHPHDGITVTQWRDRLAQRFVAELVAKPNYTQFRIIGIADGGREILRVDRSGQDGAIRIVPDAELQRQGDRDYFVRAVSLPPGEVDVSPVELNQEHGVIETPHVPVLRAAAAIHTPAGPFGVVIINVDLRSGFSRIRSAAERMGGDIYVVNERGDYLVHPDPNKEFGFEFGKPARVQDDFPSLTLALTGDEAEPRVIRDRVGEQFGAAIAPVRLAGGPRVMLIRAVPHAQVLAALTAVRNSILFAALAAVAVAIAVAGIMARSLTGPLVQMTKAVEAFSHDKPMAAPINATGEIGVLARAFDRMAAEGHERTTALRESGEMARGIINTALDAFVQMDEGGTIVEWNHQAELIFGWSRADAVGKQLGSLIVPPTHRERHSQGLARFLRTGESAMLGNRFEIEAMRRDGQEIAVELTVTALPRKGGYVFNGFIRDISKGVIADEQLRQSQKMEAVGQLTGGIAHDFNNILTVITGMTEILGEAVAADPKLASIAKMIDDAAERGAGLTQHLLAFARKQPLHPRETDINALILDAVKLLRPTLSEQIEIQSMLEEDASLALVDPSQLTTALLNLAVNARDAMPDGGKLTIETGNVVLDESYCQMHSDIRPGSYVMIAVSDTGSGIPAAIRDKVFEPFFSTKDTGKGTGLGLSMVYGFVKQSGGHVKIYSEEKHGTTIKIYLPRSDSAATDAIDQMPMDLPIRGGDETVLIAEDDLMVRNYVTAQIESLGYRTLSASHSLEALSMLDHNECVDLLFTDVIMPGGMNGRQLADEARRRRPGLKVLFTSGYTENAIVHHGRLDPGVLLLPKPYRKSDLARMLRLALSVAEARERRGVSMH